MSETICVGDRVRFKIPLSNGGTATWTAVVVIVEDDGTCLVRHPIVARSMPFSPVKKNGLYRYTQEAMLKARTGRTGSTRRVTSGK